MVLVDTNVLIDVAVDDPKWADWSANHLAQARETQALAMNAIVYAELSVHFDSAEELEAVLAPFRFQRLHLPWEAAFVAAKAFKRYRTRGGSKTSPLPDFFIGAHAATAGLTLLTRDPRRYREYFPTVKLTSPKS
jgi:predicted nucleic acid-binding protein